MSQNIDVCIVYNAFAVAFLSTSPSTDHVSRKFAKAEVVLLTNSFARVQFTRRKQIHDPFTDECYVFKT